MFKAYSNLNYNYRTNKYIPKARANTHTHTYTNTHSPKYTLTKLTQSYVESSQKQTKQRKQNS